MRAHMYLYICTCKLRCFSLPSKPWDLCIYMYVNKSASTATRSPSFTAAEQH